MQIYDLFYRRDTTAMLLRSLRTIVKTNTRSINKTAHRSLFASGQSQIRKLSTTDPKEAAPIDPLNYKIEPTIGVFQDRSGKHRAEVELTKDEVKIFKVNHVNITGNTFSALRPSGPLSDIFSTNFALHNGNVDKYTLEFIIRIPISTNTETGTKHDEGKLFVKVAVDQAERPRQIYQLTLRHGEHVIKAEPSDKFGEALLDIQLQLPIKTYIRSCFMCTHSEYYPLSNGEFGSLGCFKQWPGIQSVKVAQELLFHWAENSDQVQETYRCPQFRRRTRPHVTPREGESFVVRSHDTTLTAGAITEEKEWSK